MASSVLLSTLDENVYKTSAPLESSANNNASPLNEVKRLRVNDYFEVVGPLQRKCRLCSKTVRIVANNNWGMRQHFSKKHRLEWTMTIEPFMKKRVSKPATVTLKSEPTPSDMIGGNDDVNYFEGGPIFAPRPNSPKTSSPVIDAVVPKMENGFALDPFSDNKNSVKNWLIQDDSTIFGNFIATEMRNMTDIVRRRQFKRSVQQLLLDFTD